MRRVETTGFPEANARLTLALYFEPERKVLPQRGEIDMKGMAAAIAFMAEGGVLKPPLPPPYPWLQHRARRRPVGQRLYVHAWSRFQRTGRSWKTSGWPPW